MQLSILSQANSVIPADLGEDSEKKLLYIKWRVCGFDNQEAIVRAGVTSQRVDGWWANQEFVSTMDSIWEMQTELADVFIRQEETKNRIKLSALDGKVIDEATDQGIKVMDKQSFEYLQAVKRGLEMTGKEKSGLGIDPDDRAPLSVHEMLVQINNGVTQNEQPAQGISPPSAKEIPAIVEGEVVEE